MANLQNDPRLKIIRCLTLLFCCWHGVSLGDFAASAEQQANSLSRQEDCHASSQNNLCSVSICVSTSPNLRSGKNLILLGRFEAEPYVVAIPGRDRTQLQQVRQCIPDALILPSRRGQYIHVASFEDLRTARRLSQLLRKNGLDARVAYFTR